MPPSSAPPATGRQRRVAVVPALLVLRLAWWCCCVLVGGSGLGNVANAATVAADFTPEKKVIILHDAHEGSHGTCQSFAYLCVPTDCSESHDALYHNRSIDFDAIDASDAHLFLTRFFPQTMDMAVWRNYNVLMLVRLDLMAWSLGAYKGSNPHDQLGKPGDLVYFNVSHMDKVVQRKITAWRSKLLALRRLTTEVPDIVVRVYFYDKFLDEGLDYLRRVAQSVGLVDDDPNDSNCTTPCSTSYGDATNCDELQKYFHQDNDFPTWHSLAADEFGNLSVL